MCSIITQKHKSIIVVQVNLITFDQVQIPAINPAFIMSTPLINTPISITHTFQVGLESQIRQLESHQVISADCHNVEGNQCDVGAKITQKSEICHPPLYMEDP